MKNILLTAAIAVTLIGGSFFVDTQANAGTICERNFLGNIECRDTNDYLGRNKVTIEKDPYRGDVRIRDNQYRTLQRCRTDILGRTVCN